MKNFKLIFASDPGYDKGTILINGDNVQFGIVVRRLRFVWYHEILVWMGFTSFLERKKHTTYLIKPVSSKIRLV